MIAFFIIFHNFLTFVFSATRSGRIFGKWTLRRAQSCLFRLLFGINYETSARTFRTFLLFRCFFPHSSCALDVSECKLHATSSAANVYLSFGHRKCVAKLMKFIFVRFIKSNLIFCVNQNALIGLALCMRERDVLVKIATREHSKPKNEQFNHRRQLDWRKLLILCDQNPYIVHRGIWHFIFYFEKKRARSVVAERQKAVDVVGHVTATTTVAVHPILFLSHPTSISFGINRNCSLFAVPRRFAFFLWAVAAAVHK